MKFVDLLEFGAFQTPKTLLAMEIRNMLGNLHIPSTWFLVLFNVLLFHSLQFGLLVMFGMELEGYMNTFVSCKIVVC